MQLKMTTDYALRIILYLVERKKVNSLQIASDLHISINYVRKLIRQPEMTKYIESQAGMNGGLLLKQDVTDITMLDIIQSFEKDTFISHCLEREDDCVICRLFSKEQCPVRRCYAKLQESLDEIFGNVKFNDLV